MEFFLKPGALGELFIILLGAVVIVTLAVALMYAGCAIVEGWRDDGVGHDRQNR